MGRSREREEAGVRVECGAQDREEGEGGDSREGP